MPGHRYVEEINLVAILANKRSAGITPEVNVREHVTHTHIYICLCQVQIRLPTLALKPEETSPEVQSRGIIGPTKRTYVLQIFFNKSFEFSRVLKYIEYCTTVKYTYLQWISMFSSGY